ncbi:MAG: AsmA family protein [Rhodospirillaceae bacterium]|nr:AsmA family protein [Rhodospirillales bacterium]
MRNTALIVGTALAVLLVLAVAVPALIDWSRYKDQIIARAEASTGRPVTISGPVRLRLLPSPAISAEGLAVGNPPGTEGQLATVERLRLRLALLPLLVGRVEISSLELDRPVLHLARLPDGRSNWQLKAEDKAEEPTEAPHRAAKAEPPPPPEAGKDVPVEHIAIHQGSVTYASGAGAPVGLDGIDATVSMGGRSGPFLAKGEAKLAGTLIAFDAAMDRLAPGRASPASLTLHLPGNDAKMEFSGLVSRLSGGETLRGRLTASAVDLGRTLARLGINAPIPTDAALAVDSELTISAEEITAANLTASVGDTRATGSVTAASSQVDVRLNVAALDLDKWQTPAAPAKASAPAKESAKAGEPSAPPPAAAPKPGGFALPGGLFVSTALSVDTLSWRGQVAREVQLEAVMDQGEIMIHKAAAQLPGGSLAVVEGALTAENGQPVFDGKAQLRSDNLRALLAWANVNPQSVPENRLRALDFASPVRLAWPALTLSDFRLTLDGAQARGALTAHLAAADRLAFGLDASVDSVNVDSYLGAKPPATEAKAAPTASQPTAKTEAAPPQPNALARFDANVKLAVRRLVLNDITADSVTVDAMLQAGQLTLNQLSADMGGTQAKAQGRVLGLAESNPRVDKLAFQVTSPQPSRLLRFLGLKPPALTERLGTLTASGTASGGADQLTLDARAETGGLELTARGAVTPRADVTVQARHASTAQLIRIFSPDYRPKGTIGAFALDGKVTGDGKTMDVSGLILTAGQARLTGQGHVDLSGAKPQITADLTGNALALDPFLAAERTGMLLPGGPHMPPSSAPAPMTVIPAAAAVGAGPSPFSTEPLDMSALQGFDARLGLKAETISAKGWQLDQPVAQLSVLNGTASVERLTGKLLGGDMTATAKLSSGATPALSGQISVLGADVGAAKPGAGGINVTKGRLDAETRFTTSGRSSQDMAARLNGDGKLLVRDGIIEGFDLPAVNQRLNNLENIGSLLGVAQAGMSGGQTPFTQLYGTFRAENGVVSSRDLKLEAQGATATAETTNDLPRWTTNTRIAFALANAPQTPLGIRFEGPLDNPRKIIDVNALQQYLVSRGLGRALKGKGGETLQGLFGKGEPSGETQQSEQPREKNTGKAILKDLLKGLGGR